MVRRSFVALVALSSVLWLGACSDDGEQPLTALAPVDRAVQTNPDRDAVEVEENSAAIDPCALLRAAPADAVTRGAVPEADGPHSCWMSDGSVRADAYTLLSEPERHRLLRQDLAGVAAYRADLDRGQCLVHLPISHSRAISFSGLARCATVTAYTEAAAVLLRDHPVRATRPTGLQRATACDLIEAAGRTAVPDEGATNYTVLDQCDDEATGADLELRYSDGLVRDYHTTHDVAGTTVRANDSGQSCYLDWTLGEADVTVGEGDRLIAVVDARTCRNGLAFARAIIPATKDVSTPDRDPVDLLYATDEVDTSAAGACVDINDQARIECTPAEDAEVPGDRRDLIMAAEADPNVLCAAATPVVREHFGDSFTGATTVAPSTTFISSAEDPREGATQCSFGDPAHVLEISVAIATDSMSTYEDPDDIGGHPARVVAEDTYRSYAVARDAMGDPGFLVVELEVRPARGTGIYRTSDGPAPVDTQPLDEADAFVADLADALL